MSEFALQVKQQVLRQIRVTTFEMIVRNVDGQVSNNIVQHCLTNRAKALLCQLDNDKTRLCRTEATLNWVNKALALQSECLVGTLNSLSWLCRFVCTRSDGDSDESTYQGLPELYELLDSLRTEFGNMVFLIEDAGYQLEGHQAFSNIHAA